MWQAPSPPTLIAMYLLARLLLDAFAELAPSSKVWVAGVAAIAAGAGAAE